jgi:hypothetical protein
VAAPDLDRLKAGAGHIAADRVELGRRHALDCDTLGLAPVEGL